MEFELPDGTPEEIAELFKKDEVKSIVAQINKGVADKNKELLGQLSLSKKDINDLGGLETIKQKLAAFADFEAERKSKQAKTEPDDVEAVKKAFQQKLDDANEKLEQHERERVQAKVNAQITKALGDNAEAFDVLEPFLMRRLKPETDSTGAVRISILTAEGGPMLTEKGDATLKDLIAEFRDSSKFSPLFKADNKSGSGAKSTTGAVVTENPFDKNTPYFDVIKQGEIYKSDPTKARALAAAAKFPLWEQ